jgi:hypothetical protein
MRLFFIICGIAMTWGGGQGLYTYYKNSKPTEYTIGDLYGKKPTEKWLKITNCYLDLTQACYFGIDVPDEVYVPLLSEDDKDAKRVCAFAVFKDKNIAKLCYLIINTKDEGKLDGYLQEYSKTIWQSGITVNGVVQYGIDLDSKIKRRLTASFPNTTEDFLIIEDNTQPSVGAGYFFLIVGIMLLIYNLVKLGNRSTDTKTT